MNARDKAYIGATAMFDAPQKPGRDELTRRERTVILKVLRAFDRCNDDEMAIALMVCIMILGERLAEKREAKK